MPYCLHLPWIDSFHYASQTAPEARAFIGQNVVKGDNPEVNRNFHFPLQCHFKTVQAIKNVTLPLTFYVELSLFSH